MESPPERQTATPESSWPEKQPVRFAFRNTYARLPERFYARVNPVPVAAPRLVKLNTDLARTLGLDPEELGSPEGVAVLAGNHVPYGSEPLAMAYAGHQFGQFVPQLGDGRANLLGEVVGRDGGRYDLQLKGSGPTPFSRRGDGRAALGPVLREYLVSEAMAAMGVPTTRALAAVITGEQVLREVPMLGAVLTRVASSHLRVGTFQYFRGRDDTDALRELADYAMARHYPEARESAQPYRALLDGVVARQAELISRWMLIGFVHGVMNTDNTSISGETIDYGPCAFMEAYDPQTVFSSIDRMGRYAYENQPGIMLWNLTRLAESLLPLLEEEQGGAEPGLESAKEALAEFAPQYEAAYLRGMRRKLGLSSDHADDAALVADLLEQMRANEVDFTVFFRRLSNIADNEAELRAMFQDAAAYDMWAARWKARLALEPMAASERSAAMKQVNPAFIPRNHLLEEALTAAVERDDFGPFEALLEVALRPYEDQPGKERFQAPAQPQERVRWTFCGT